jgi:predicted ABC-class ATPase
MRIYQSLLFQFSETPLQRSIRRIILTIRKLIATTQKENQLIKEHNKAIIRKLCLVLKIPISNPLRLQ